MYPAQQTSARREEVPVPTGYRTAFATRRYQGSNAAAARLKYRNDRRELDQIVRAMAEVMPVSADAVTWLPTTRRRRARRGYDQAEVLAKALARLTGRPALPLLSRLPGSPQTGRTARQRRRDPPRFTSYGGRASPLIADLVVVDDVLTTGSTFMEAAEVLTVILPGVRLHALVVEFTPAKRGSRSSPRSGVAPGHLESFHGGWFGSVVESRSQSQAKRPT